LQEINGFTIGYALLAPRSRGSATLASGDPGTVPAIDPGLLADDRDAAGMLANTNATVLAIAERAADILKAQS